MDKVWYILIDGKGFGPLSIIELKRHPYVTPDTLVWRDGFDKWLPMREVKELESVFKDPQEATKPSPFPDGKKKDLFKVKDTAQEELILEWKFPPPLFLFLWFVIITLLIYVIFRS